MSDHIVKAYDHDLETLGRSIAEMGGIAEKMLAEAMDALAAFDVELAQRVVATDPRLDALQREIEEKRDPHHRAAPADGRRSARMHRARSASPATSNASAISPRTSPSARSRSSARRACRAPSSA